ncbi:PR domain zinc finger protein 14-like isoform X2 [Tachypleus tridentatus]|uniref:PR domain zinc finger protein 14-like isoform X2 n=1 Tax=Tachypleus tridentatus TaxID=6853 RepID=UPI003FD3FD76
MCGFFVYIIYSTGTLICVSPGLIVQRTMIIRDNHTYLLTSNSGPCWRGIRISCEICSKTFSCKSSLRVHRHYQHIRKRNFSCSLCGKILTRKQSLDRHIRVIL